jgi:hypothetical protein
VSGHKLFRGQGAFGYNTCTEELTDARHPQDEEFGVERTRGVSSQHPRETLRNLVGPSFRAIEEFPGDFRQSDDRTRRCFITPRVDSRSRVETGNCFCFLFDPFALLT